MKPLVVLLSVFLLSMLVYWFVSGDVHYRSSGKIALSAMLVLTAIGHFKFKKGMALMLPANFPAREFTVILTGLIELLAAIGIHIPVIQRLTGILLIIFFICILPANVYAAYKKVNFETGEYNGSGMKYLWFRIPLQLLFIWWTYIMVVL